MPSLLIWAVTAALTYFVYAQLHDLFQKVVRRAPPVAANSWWAFLRGKGAPGAELITGFYEKVSLFYYFAFF